MPNVLLVCVRDGVCDAGEHFLDLNNIASPLQNIRQVFDQMPRSTEEEWSNIAARLASIPCAAKNPSADNPILTWCVDTAWV